MLATIRRLRLAQLLAALAIILMASLGQHAHASVAAAPLALERAAAGEADGKAAPPAAHCAACHLVRAMTPNAASVRQPAILGVVMAAPGGDLRPDLAVPDGPVRPPRQVPAA